MIAQFEAIVNDKNSLLQYVNRHINGLMQHELKKLQDNGIISRTTPNALFPNPHFKN